MWLLNMLQENIEKSLHCQRETYITRSVSNYVCVPCGWTLGLANWNTGTERDGNKVLPKFAVSNQGPKSSLQQVTEELYQHGL